MNRLLVSVVVAMIGLTAPRPASADGGPSNQTLNVQGILRTIAGDLQTVPVGLVVSLYSSKDAPASAAFYSQSFTTVQVENGFFSVELSGMNLSFNAADAWVGIQVAGDAAEMPRQHLTAVPYAFTSAHANTCDVANGLSATATVDAKQVSGRRLGPDQLERWRACLRQHTEVGAGTVDRAHPRHLDYENQRRVHAAHVRRP